MLISQWISENSKKLAGVGIESSVLDAQLILCVMLKKPREYLLAHSNETLPEKQLELADQYILRRLKREPIAYILGKKEFYGREFIVTPDTLIPRPESEAIIEIAKSNGLCGRVLDVGCGSGCLGLTLKAEIPDINLTLSDISPKTLDIARKNAKNLDIKPVRFVISDLLEHWLNHEKPKTFDVMVANLPYVDKSWETSVETKYEPKIALFSDDHGLQDIKKLIKQAKEILIPEGYLLLEANPHQHESMTKYAKEQGFNLVETEGFIVLYKLLA